MFGSRSTEHEVSVVTAMQVIKFLAERHEVTPIYITKEGKWFTSPKLTKLETYKTFNPQDTELQSVVLTPDCGLQTILNPLPKGFFGKAKKLELDVIFPAFHGTNGEDGTIQGLLELANMPYVGAGVLASAIGMDKIATKAMLRENGLPILEYFWFTRARWEQDSQAVVTQIEQKFPYPLIVKPANLGSSIGIQKAKDTAELQFAIDVAMHYSSRIMVEPYLAERLEINCAVLGDAQSQMASVCEQPITKDALLSYQDKYLHNQQDRGMEGAQRLIPAPISAELTKQIQDLACQAFRCMDGAGVARVDFIINQKTQQIYINELNTMPGSISYYLWEPTGLNSAQLVDKLIELAFQVQREKRKTKYSIDSRLLQSADLLGVKKWGDW